MTAVSGTYTEVLDQSCDRFTMPLFGGWDGTAITEKDPFRNTLMDSTSTEITNAVYGSIKRAIDSVSDPEVVEMNMLSVPGLTLDNLTTHVINVCEDRADSLGVIDLDGNYIPSSENDDDVTDRLGSVTQTINNLKDRGLDSSYGCAYYPWVQIRDQGNGSMLWVPPSVVALGTLGSSASKSELWFAPAGFNRGGLTEGSAGVSVTNVVQRLTSKDRDKLYDASINPIASFPSEGLVVFGQKTLQVTPSALDRINVRRLLIFLKREISRISATLLFDQNVQATWNRFLAQVNPFLASVRSRLGLMDYKVVLDNTTTTPDLIDRNIMYAKIFLKPAKAIEFIALDFVITDSGASFED
jgi:phage tail sheath protein FI